MHGSLLFRWLFLCLSLTTRFEAEGMPATTQHVLPRLLEERSSEGRLTLLVNEDIALSLEKTSAFADNFEVAELAERTNIFREMSISSLHGDVYKDDKNHAAVLISREDGLRIKGIIRGSLRIYYLKDAVSNKNGHVLHSLNKIEHNTFDEIQSNILDDGIAATRSSHEGTVLSPRNDRSTKGVKVTKNITVEARVVISADYAATVHSNDYSDVNSLVDYLRVYFAFVNIVCKRFDKKVLDLQISVVGLVLLQRTTETFMHKFRNADAIKVDTLNDFNKFINKKFRVFKRDDIVIYMTRYRIGKMLSGGSVDQSGAGLAGVGGACTDQRGSLVTDEPKKFTGVYNAVHEILHLLGCAHDGQPAPKYLENSPGGTACSSQGDFVMTAIHNGNRKLTISQCTQRQVLFFLSIPRGHCLLSKATRHTTMVTMKNMFVNRERFCRRMVPGISTVKFLPHLDEENDIKKCVLMCGWKTKNALNVRLTSAPDYTPCKMVKNKVAKMPEAIS